MRLTVDEPSCSVVGKEALGTNCLDPIPAPLLYAERTGKLLNLSEPVFMSIKWH